MLIRKHINKTTIALEPVFWTTIEGIAKPDTLQTWVTEQLLYKPENTSRASWLRQQVLLQFQPIFRTKCRNNCKN
ncbi:MAG: ribbon-helix-helix domain-containing protein [Colwellia sp.]|nr:ribbon-helix-helix domain-containing protein [Colwellia sp.]